MFILFVYLYVRSLACLFILIVRTSLLYRSEKREVNTILFSLLFQQVEPSRHQNYIIDEPNLYTQYKRDDRKADSWHSLLHIGDRNQRSLIDPESARNDESRNSKRTVCSRI